LRKVIEAISIKINIPCNVGAQFAVFKVVNSATINLKTYKYCGLSELLWSTAYGVLNIALFLPRRAEQEKLGEEIEPLESKAHKPGNLASVSKRVGRDQLAVPTPDSYLPCLAPASILLPHEATSSIPIISHLFVSQSTTHMGLIFTKRESFKALFTTHSFTFAK